jgi:uncharacterized protein DUF6459
MSADNAVQPDPYSASSDRCPSTSPVPTVSGATAWDRLYGVSGPAVDLTALTAWSYRRGESVTTSIAEPCPQRPQRPVLRRLADILPAAAPATPEPLATTALPAPDPTASILAERVLRAVVEVIGSRRPAQQLSKILRPDLLASLTALQATAAPLQPRVRKVVARLQGPGVVEAVAVVTLSTGVRALAARFEKPRDDQGARWRCTALQLRLTTGDLAFCRRHRQR